MPFIELGDEFKNAKEAPLAPEGQYDLVCDQPQLSEDQSQLIVTIRLEGTDYKPIREQLSLPGAPATQARNRKIEADKGMDEGLLDEMQALGLKRFLHFFGVKWEASGKRVGFNTDHIAGARKRGLVSRVSYETKDGRPGQANRIKYPSLPEDMQ